MHCATAEHGRGDLGAGTYEGSPEYLGQLRRQWNARSKLEEKHPELRGDRRPVLAHEGRYRARPLRAGDPPADP